MTPNPVLFLLAAASGGAPAAGADFFEARVRPVLADRCYKCHSEAAKKTKGGLALDSIEGLRKGGGSGPLFVAGDPEQSLLIKAIRRKDPDTEMPPDDDERVPPVEVARLEAWVKMGAPLPAAGPAPNAEAQARWRQHWAFAPPREATPPEVRDERWPRTPVDRFVLAKLEPKGLGPRPPADPRTLIRRATYDLTGLPPTEREIAAFVGDRSPSAFAKVIDRLLASPQYGERWGRHWLDVARYADTKGYVYADREEPRFVHSWAYRDWVIRAFNQDMPYDRFVVAQLAADQDPGPRDPSALAAMGFLTVGRRFINNIHDIIDDRIDVVGRGLMGLSVGCARCHDHKFDPIPIQDYYSLYGVFAGSAEKAVPLPRPSARRTPELAAFEAELARRRAALESAFRKHRDELLDRLRAKVADYLRAVLEVEKIPTEEFYTNLDPDDVNPVIVRRWHVYLLGRKGQAPDAVFGAWHGFADLPRAQVAARAPEVLRGLAGDREANPLVARAFAEGAAPASMGDVADRYGKVLGEIHRAAKEAPGKPLADPAAEALRQVLYAADSPIAMPEGGLSEVEWVFDEKTRVALGKLQMAIDAWLLEAPGAVPYAAILEDRPVQADPRIFRRGNPATKGEAVPRRLLAVLAQGEERQPFQQGSGRLELARAIASPDNPFTARVMVNRLWKHHFGAGLVATPSDFGVRSDPPSHPELLDWLARRFVADGWSVKRLHRLIMLSAVYQQASDDDPRAREIDPVNALLWRMNRRRLDFEELRDSLLAVAGRLDRAMGGRPISLVSQPASRRRSVYGFVDRLNLPGMLRTFDFAGPDAHSPQRLLTTVPQQALFMMNGSFMAENARALARRPEVAGERTPGRRLARMYGIALGRPPTAEELKIGLGLVADLERLQGPAAAGKEGTGAWSYLCGGRALRPLPIFHGNAWTVVDGAYPQSGRCRLTPSGGQPGAGGEQVVVRRWTAPEDLTIDIAGTIDHDAKSGDGIRARITSSRAGELASWQLKKAEAKAEIKGVEVKRGDTIDFVVDSRGDAVGDAFKWAPVISAPEGKDKDKEKDRRGGKGRREWSASKEFAGPPAEPLGVWDKVAQVLLQSNELVFID